MTMNTPAALPDDQRALSTPSSGAETRPNRIFESCDDVVDQARSIMSLGLRDWAHRF